MRKRSFSFSAIAAQARENQQRNLEEELFLFTEEESLDVPNITQNFGSEEESTSTVAQLHGMKLNVDTETTRPRKAIPVNKPNEVAPPDPAVRPKIAMKPAPIPTEPGTEKPAPRQPTADAKPKPSGKPVEPKAMPYGERYERITTYLEKPLFRRVHDLHKLGAVNKIASLLNAAVREYLDRHYPIK
ncbi:hypothetical protein M5X11_07995 [Paenibacillus alginolyticus]|uniref:hypothetical protein n=1 Tax=Paenibacillus alginolyticus TaxID=59839 RepID=UPI0004923652|nr:hypothetical protein [Paenibacillus alginolyticus]MCY9664898.1 hypothetical protein [Paenibacillus alginolyticus]